MNVDGADNGLWCAHTDSYIHKTKVCVKYSEAGRFCWSDVLCADVKALSTLFILNN